MAEAGERPKQRLIFRQVRAILGLALMSLIFGLPSPASAGYDVRVYHMESLSKTSPHPMTAVVVTPSYQEIIASSCETEFSRPVLIPQD